MSSNPANHEQEFPLVAVESVESRRVPANLNCEEDALIPLDLQLVSLCRDRCEDMLFDKGVGRLTAGIWPGMTASQRNEKWAGLRKLTGKRQEFAVLVLRLRWGLREVLGLGETVAACTRLRVTFQSDSVLQASECVFVCVERWGVQSSLGGASEHVRWRAFF